MNHSAGSLPCQKSRMGPSSTPDSFKMRRAMKNTAANAMFAPGPAAKFPSARHLRRPNSSVCNAGLSGTVAPPKPCMTMAVHFIPPSRMASKWPTSCRYIETTRHSTKDMPHAYSDGVWRSRSFVSAAHTMPASATGSHTRYAPSSTRASRGRTIQGRQRTSSSGASTGRRKSGRRSRCLRTTLHSSYNAVPTQINTVPSAAAAARAGTRR